MSAVADVLDALMTMLSWLEKPPYGAHMIGRRVSVVEFHDPTLGIGKVFGQESTVVK